MADPLQIRRKVYFFRADAALIDDGSAGRLAAFDAGPVAACLRTMSDNERQLRRTDGRITYCRVYRSDRPQRLMLTSVSESDFPDAFNFSFSTFREFEIAENEGVALTTHFSFFDNNIVGMVAPYRGPGAGRLEEYLEKKVHDEHPNINARVTLTPLTNRDFETRLGTFRSIKALRVRVSNYEVEGRGDSQNSDHQSDDQAVVGILREMRDIGEAGEYEIVWKPRKHSRETIPEQFMGIARRLLGRDDVFHDENDKIVVRGEIEEGRTEEVDLLEGKIFFHTVVMKQSARSRSLAPGPAFAAIQEIYDDNREFLEQAAAFYT